MTLTLLLLPSIPPEVVDPDHLAAAVGIVLLPFVVAALLLVTALLADRGRPWAIAVLARLASVPAPVRVLAFLCVIDAVIHAAIVPAHVGATPVLAVLFSLDAVLLLGVAAWMLLAGGWHLPALALLLGNVFAYAYVVDGGWETMDGVGAACKLLELSALALVTIDSARHAARQAASAWP